MTPCITDASRRADNLVTKLRVPFYRQLIVPAFTGPFSCRPPVMLTICLRDVASQEKGQLLENVFADPKGFGLDPSGKYRYEMPGFSSGTAAVS